MRVRRLFLLLLALFASCAHAETIEIGAEDDWYPYSGVKNGQASGFAEDLIQEAFKAEGVEVKFNSLPYARCMGETKVGNLLGCFDVARNSLLEPNFIWPAQAMYMAHINIYALASATESGLSTADLEGREVAVTNNYEYGESFDTDRKILRSVSNQDIQGFRKLLVGRVKYMVAYDKVANYLFAQYKDQFTGKFKVVGQTGEPGLYLAFSKKYPDAQRFVDKFNAGSALIRKNGQYKLIEDKWR